MALTFSRWISQLVSAYGIIAPLLEIKLLLWPYFYYGDILFRLDFAMLLGGYKAGPYLPSETPLC